MDVSEVWRRNHPWAAVYSFGIGRPWLAGPAARLALGSDIDLLYRATAVISDLPTGSRVLDVPCGSGIALRGVREGQGLQYVAADIAPAMLERTRAAAEAAGVADQVETREADVEKLPFEDGEFDLVVSFTGLHCFPNPHAAVREISRVTAPGGRVSLSWLRNDAGPLFLPQLTFARASGLVGRSASVDEVRAWLGEGGFDDLDVVASGALAYATAVKR